MWKEAHPGQSDKVELSKAGRQLRSISATAHLIPVGGSEKRAALLESAREHPRPHVDTLQDRRGFSGKQSDR